MRKYWGQLILFLLAANFAIGQEKQNVEELKKQMTAAVSDTARFRILDRLTTDYLWYANQTDSAKVYARAELDLAEKLNQPFYLAESYVNLGWYFTITGNLGSAIELFSKATHLAEENQFNTVLMKAYFALSIAYVFTYGHLDQVLEFSRKAERLLPYQNDPMFHYGSHVYCPIAYYYKINRKLDSALIYANLANEEGLKYPAEPYGQSAAFEELAEVYDSTKDFDLSATYFKKAIRAEDTVGGVELTNAIVRYSESLQRQGKNDSALTYARWGFLLATQGHELSWAVDECNVLYKAFNALGDKDNALFYVKKRAELGDTMLNDTKRSEILGITVREQIRSMEQEKRAEAEAIQRKHNIQYAAIAICLLSFVILYFLLSKSIISARLVKYLGLLALLVSFEFISLLIHPFISSLTDDRPLLMLIILVAIGALLIPLHHRIEQWITHKLVEKNKRLKEEKIKKIVEAYQKKADSANG